MRGVKKYYLLSRWNLLIKKLMFIIKIIYGNAMLQIIRKNIFHLGCVGSKPDPKLALQFLCFYRNSKYELNPIIFWRLKKMQETCKNLNIKIKIWFLNIIKFTMIKSSFKDWFWDWLIKNFDSRITWSRICSMYIQFLPEQNQAHKQAPKMWQKPNQVRKFNLSLFSFQHILWYDETKIEEEM